MERLSGPVQRLPRRLHNHRRSEDITTLLLDEVLEMIRQSPNRLLIAVFAVLVSTLLVRAQQQTGGEARLTNIPDLNGVYLVRNYRPNLIDMGTGLKEIPFTPDAATKYKAINRSETETGPSSRCLPPGIGFLMTMPYAYEIIQTPRHVLTFHEFGNYVRQIWTDGRGHETAYPTWFGHSVGRYEEGALIVDTVAFNGKGWLDQLGLQSSDALHTVERFHRNGSTLEYSLTIEDPKTFTRPWTAKATLDVIPNGDIVEFVCLENNKLVGSPGMHVDEEK